MSRKYQSNLLVRNTDSSREFLLPDSDTDTSNSVGRVPSLILCLFIFVKIYVQEASNKKFLFNPMFDSPEKKKPFEFVLGYILILILPRLKPFSTLKS